MNSAVPEPTCYTYHDENAEIIGQWCDDSGRKFWRVPDGAGWRNASPQSVPPYRLKDILRKPTATVLICDTERDADIAAAMDMTATAHPGIMFGGFLKWLAGRNVVMLSTNPVGADSVITIAASVRVVELAGNLAAMVENGLKRDEIIAMCKAAPVREHVTEDNLRVTIGNRAYTMDEWLATGGDGAVFIAAFESESIAQDDEQRDDTPAGYDDIGPPAGTFDNAVGDASAAPFICLGYDEGHYYFLPHKTQQVVTISAGGITSAALLMQLAPVEFWQHASPNKSGVDWTGAGNMLIRWCEHRGTFDPNTIRGRGAWFDAGRAVLHLGNRLLVDHVTTGLHQIESRYIYVRGAAVESMDLVPPLSDAEATRLMAVMNGMNWTKRIEPILFAGFCVLAPICGALVWRPHGWLIAQAGSGKSWIQANIIGPLMGSTAMYAQGSSTEAYIRQKMKRDGFAVMFDEADVKTVKDRERLHKVIELARASSTDSLAGVGRGSAHGQATDYHPRSMFLLFSINTSLAEAADKSRFTVLNLRPPKSNTTAQFEALKAAVDSTLTTEWCTALRSRTYSLIPTIRANAATLAKAAAEHIGSQRAGDQVGALLAGAYSLRATDRITLDAARKWITSHDWSEQSTTTEDTDEAQLCAEIMFAQVKVDTHHGVRTRSIDELIGIITGPGEPDVSASDATATLRRHGMRVDDGALWVAESHRAIRDMLKESKWAQGWAAVLRRIPGAVAKKSMRFDGGSYRAVSVPLGAMRGGQE